MKAAVQRSTFDTEKQGYLKSHSIDVIQYVQALLQTIMSVVSAFFLTLFKLNPTQDANDA